MPNDDAVTREKLEDEIDKLLILHDKTNERISDLHSYISWSFSILGILLVIVQLGVGFILYLLTAKP